MDDGLGVDDIRHSRVMVENAKFRRSGRKSSLKAYLSDPGNASALGSGARQIWARRTGEASSIAAS